MTATEMVPPGYASDAIAEPYGTFSYLPSLGRWVRIRYYLVPISYPIYNGPDGTYSYGSFNYDLSKDEWPGYGEYGPQGPYWVNGEPPPWAPLALDATGDSEIAVRGIVVTRSLPSSERVTESASRSLALARFPLSSARDGESVSRILVIAALATESERISSSASRALAVLRNPQEAERVASIASRTLTVSPKPLEAERLESISVGTPIVPACTSLSAGHANYTVTMAAPSNFFCTDCANAGRTWHLVNDANCHWTGETVTICGTNQTATLSIVAGTVTFQIGSKATYSVALGAWTGGTNLSMPLTFNDAFSCVAWPAPITLVPA